MAQHPLKDGLSPVGVTNNPAVGQDITSSLSHVLGSNMRPHPPGVGLQEVGQVGYFSRGNKSASCPELSAHYIKIWVCPSQKRPFFNPICEFSKSNFRRICIYVGSYASYCQFIWFGGWRSVPLITFWPTLILFNLAKHVTNKIKAKTFHGE